MHAQEVLSDLKAQELEILTEERLTKVVEGNESKTAYIGVEPSSSIHIGNVAGALPLFTLAKHGFKSILLLADLHALANDKGDMREIQEYARLDQEMVEKFAKKLGIGAKIEYKLGSDFEDQDYFVKLLKLAKSVNLTEAEKSMDEIAKKSVNRMTSSIFYPLMQVLDIGVLAVNVAIGSIDQRKVHVLAIENLKKLGFATPVAIHNRVIMQGIDGSQKMSKSLGNAIGLDETQDTLEKKIKKTFCAPGNLEVNPILGWYRGVIFPFSNGPFNLPKGPLMFGNYTAASAEELVTLWSSNKVTPQELKAAALRDLTELLL